MSETADQLDPMDTHGTRLCPQKHHFQNYKKHSEGQTAFPAIKEAVLISRVCLADCYKCSRLKQ